MPDTWTATNGRRVLLVGSGSMGGQMAYRLDEMGFDVSIYARRRNARQVALADDGFEVIYEWGQLVDLPAWIVFSLPDGAAVRQVMQQLVDRAAQLELGEHWSVMIDTSTISPAESIANGEFAERYRMTYLECPVSGGPKRARTGDLTGMIAGTPSAKRGARPILEALFSRMHEFERMGQGQAVKACNNLLVGAIMLANAEVLYLGDMAGLDISQLREVILASSGANWQLEHIVPHTILRDNYAPLFELRHLIKDLKIGDDLASATGAPLSHVRSARQHYERAQTEYGESADFSSVFLLQSLGSNPQEGR